MMPGELGFWALLFIVILVVAALARSSGKKAARREAFIKNQARKTEGNPREALRVNNGGSARDASKEPLSAQAAHDTVAQASETAPAKLTVESLTGTRKATARPSSAKTEPADPSKYIEVLLEPSRWGAYELDTGKIYQGRIKSRLEEIPLEQCIAYLVASPDRTDSAKVIRLIVEKHRFEKIYGLFASSVGFDANGYACLGEIVRESHEGKPQSYATRLYQKKQNPETYCIASFISNVPVKATECDAIITELQLHQLYDDENANRDMIAEILEQRFPYEPMRFSGTRGSKPDGYHGEGDAEEQLPQLSPQQWNSLRGFAGALFKGSRPVFQEPSSDLDADRIRAMRLLVELIASVDDWRIGSYSFMDRTVVKENELRVELSHHESSCYDGGSGGTWDHYWYLYLQRTDQDWEWVRNRYGLSKTAQEYAERKISFRKPLPGEDCEYTIDLEYESWRHRVITYSDVYLKNPLGLAGVYHLWLNNEQY